MIEKRRMMMLQAWLYLLVGICISSGIQIEGSQQQRGNVDTSAGGLIIPLRKAQVAEGNRNQDPSSSTASSTSHRRRLSRHPRRERRPKGAARRHHHSATHHQPSTSSSSASPVLSSSSSVSSSSSASSSMALKDYWNNQYVGQVGIGQPVQWMNVVFDTGSSDLWIPGRGCTECGNHQVFNYQLSSTYERVSDLDGNDRTFEVDYGSGKVRGYEGSETISLGENIIINDVRFGEVVFEDEEIRSFMMDGIVGLGFSGLSIVTEPTLLELFHQQNPDISNQFSIYLSSDPSDDEEHPSLLIMGGYALSLVSENATWHYTPVVRYGFGDDTYWSVKVQSVVVTDKDNPSMTLKSFCGGAGGRGSKAPCKAIVDSGTSELGVPTAYFQDLISYITKGLNCQDNVCHGASLDDFPDLSFGLYPDNIFPLRAEDYVACSRWSGQCIVRIQEVTNTDFWILGCVFMEAYYTLFDVENMRVGFACDGKCSGGSWHGIGFAEDLPPTSSWLKLAFLATVVLGISSLVYSIFTVLPYMMTRVRGYRSISRRFDPPLVSRGEGEDLVII